jgi:tRNA-splicing ligase RtcB
MSRMFEVTGDPGSLIKCWNKYGDPFETSAWDQLKAVASLSFVGPHVAVMPDCHTGYAVPIGTVLPTRKVIMPMAVGVDIGCGMIAVRTNVDRQDLVGAEDEVRNLIEVRIPHGRSGNGDPAKDKGAWPSYEAIPGFIDDIWSDVLVNPLSHLIHDLGRFNANMANRIEKANSYRHLGTLGTGNHFIELADDSSGKVWIVIHSGSRGVGATIASTFHAAALRLCQAWHVDLPNDQMAYFPDCHKFFQDYLGFAMWAQDYADLNRRSMLTLVVQTLGDFFGGKEPDLDLEFSCHHNFIAQERHFGEDLWITRKGAVRAREGDPVVIPGSMGAETYLGYGRGEKHSFNSCSHGAGRRMARKAAKREITIEEHENDTDGVSCVKDASVLDESPRAYKDVARVIRSQPDLFRASQVIKQFINVKGTSHGARR